MVVAWIAAQGGESVWRKCHKVGQGKSPRDVLDMRVQTPILVDHDYAGQLRHRLGAGVGADRPHKITLDAPVALRGGHGLVTGLDPVIGAGDLLAQSVIRHQWH